MYSYSGCVERCQFRDRIWISTLLCKVLEMYDELWARLINRVDEVHPGLTESFPEHAYAAYPSEEVLLAPVRLE
jgi:hypothetical protein